MTRNEIIGKLQKIFDSLFLEPVQVTEDLSADDVSEWDSMLHITLVVTVEKTFGIRFSIGEVESTRNVGEFVDIIQRRIA